MRDKWVLGLAALGAAVWAARDAVYGIGFMARLGAAALLGLAALVWLGRDFKNPSLKRGARLLLRAAAVGLAMFAASFIFVEGLIFSGAKGNAGEQADILIVLGAGLRGSTPSAVLTSRLRAAAEYMKEHPETSAILTGGQGPGEDITEALAMKKYLTAAGIDEGRLILEEQARNTAQNIKFSVALMEELGMGGSVMVVSNEFHLYRAVRIFSRYDMKVQSLAAPTPDIGLVPLNSYVREYFSIVVMAGKNLLGIDE